MSVRFTERLEEISARPSFGTGADSYDNALGEKTNGLCKTTRGSGPDTPRLWEDVDEVERTCSHGCIGSTRGISTGATTTCPTPSSGRRTTLPKYETPPESEFNSSSLH